MLEDYEDLQPIIIKTLINSIKKDIYSHAYIIETHKDNLAFPICLSFAKSLLCPNKYINNKLCDKCFQCKRIDENNYTELKIIEAEGQWIKKEQLEDLKKTFLTKPIEGNKKIYIIKEANKMNDVCSNSLLKFLEEPEQGIIAILLVENKNQLLKTIVSRCQVFSLNPHENLDKLSFFEKLSAILNIEFEDNEESKVFISKVLDFIEYNEENGLETIAYENSKWNSNFNEKNQISKALSIILIFYKDVLNYKLSKKTEIFLDEIELIKFVSDKYDITVITKKINIIIDIREKIKFNMNSNLLIDKLIIDLKECETND